MCVWSVFTSQDWQCLHNRHVHSPQSPHPSVDPQHGSVACSVPRLHPSTFSVPSGPSSIFSGSLYMDLYAVGKSVLMNSESSIACTSRGLSRWMDCPFCMSMCTRDHKGWSQAKNASLVNWCQFWIIIQNWSHIWWWSTNMMSKWVWTSELFDTTRPHSPTFAARGAASGAAQVHHCRHCRRRRRHHVLSRPLLPLPTSKMRSLEWKYRKYPKIPAGLFKTYLSCSWSILPGHNQNQIQVTKFPGTSVGRKAFVYILCIVFLSVHMP